tara:strand:- start:101 stop:289 length:189 start_codon:yes stop_codon:yes gene_type:complete
VGEDITLEVVMLLTLFVVVTVRMVPVLMQAGMGIKRQCVEDTLPLVGEVDMLLADVVGMPPE